jgi:DNA-binding transcriptional MerR regulator/quercetin dioxygenase-like cupin family protein
MPTRLRTHPSVQVIALSVMAGNMNEQSTMRVGELAASVGVSVQTIRLWEKQGLIRPERTTGGQRVFSATQVERASRIAALRRRHGWNPAAIRSALAGNEVSPTVFDSAETSSPTEQAYGPKIRAARKARGLTLNETARRSGLSRSALSSIELGHDAVTPHLLAAIADTLGLGISAFVPPVNTDDWVLRVDERPITTMAGGVRWEELAKPGHGLEPALLIVPAGGSSGGSYTRPDELWVTILKGELVIAIGDETRILGEGDSILLEPHAVCSWHNETQSETRAIYVERCPPLREAPDRRQSPTSTSG